nr:MAG TPA: hypothetical protein [Caudoviricetes sp.]
MKTIDIYYVGDEDCLPIDEEDLEAYIDTESPSRRFGYSKELEEILCSHAQALGDRSVTYCNLYPDDVLLLIEYCAKRLRTHTDITEDPITPEEEAACLALLSFFGSECASEIASYFFVLNDNNK